MACKIVKWCHYPDILAQITAAIRHGSFIFSQQPWQCLLVGKDPKNVSISRHMLNILSKGTTMSFLEPHQPTVTTCDLCEFVCFMTHTKIFMTSCIARTP